MVVATQMVGGIVTDTASSQVAVKPAAKASYQWQDVCVGSKTLFDNQTQNNNTIIKSYSWNFGDPAILTDTTSAKQAEYTYDMHGVYDVKLVVTNTLGCTDTIINKVNIFESPAADFTWNNNCESRPVYFADKSEGSSSAIVNWNWQFSDAGKVLDKSSGQNCTYNFVYAGTYSADMKVTDKNGCSTTINKQVTISPNPVAAFTILENHDNIQGRVMLSNGTINGTNNYWDFGNGETSFGSEPVVTFTDEGHYTIQLLTWNDQNCSDTISMSYDLMYKGLYVPNAFSPDDINPEVAVFRPKGMNLKSYHIEIYDRWGNMLWKSDKLDDTGSPAESWDGKYKGELLQQDAYVWKIIAQYRDGARWDGHNTGNNDNMPQLKTGTVTLLR
jgi:gliding motility-associated-like protein